MSLSPFFLYLSLTHSFLFSVRVGSCEYVTIIIEEDIENLRGYDRKTVEIIKVGRGRSRNDVKTGLHPNKHLSQIKSEQLIKMVKIHI